MARPFLKINAILTLVFTFGQNSASMLLRKIALAFVILSCLGHVHAQQDSLLLHPEHLAEKDIYPECETIRIEQVNEAYERLLRNDVRYRFVIEMDRPA